MNDKVLDDIYNGKVSDISPELYKAYSDNLHHGVSGVFGENKPGSKQYAIQQQIEANTARFAAYKAYNATQQIKSRLVDKDGVLLPKEDYRQRGQAVINAFNRYQAAEYNTAVSRSRTAKQWIRFTEDETSNELFPNLRWLESRSAERRAEHMAFYNRIWAKIDPFWSRNQPGDLWNCSCDWEETSDDENNEGVKSSKPNKGLEGNPGETGEIFTDNCVYVQASNKDLVDRAILQMGADANYPKPDIHGVAINASPLHGIKEVAGNMDVLNTFLEQRTNIKNVELLPNITSENNSIKHKFYPEGKAPRGKNRNADAIIEFKDGTRWVTDLKCMQGNGSKIIDRLKEAYEQADYSIIKINGKMNIENIQKEVTHFMKQHTHFKGITVFDNRGSEIINKQRDA